MLSWSRDLQSLDQPPVLIWVLLVKPSDCLDRRSLCKPITVCPVANTPLLLFEGTGKLSLGASTVGQRWPSTCEGEPALGQTLACGLTVAGKWAHESSIVRQKDCRMEGLGLAAQEKWHGGGCGFLDQVEQTSSPHSARDLAGPGFPAQSDRLANHQEDDVDLEALVNDMNASLESLYSACSMQSETAPRLQNGPHTRSQPPSGARPLQPQVSPRQKVQRSQPMHILAVRCDLEPPRASGDCRRDGLSQLDCARRKPSKEDVWEKKNGKQRLQEEDQQFRTSSLPAIPNPFPELCGPGSPPVLTHGSLPPSQAAVKQEEEASKYRPDSNRGPSVDWQEPAGMHGEYTQQSMFLVRPEQRDQELEIRSQALGPADAHGRGRSSPELPPPRASVAGTKISERLGSQAEFRGHALRLQVPRRGAVGRLILCLLLQLLLLGGTVPHASEHCCLNLFCFILVLFLKNPKVSKCPLYVLQDVKVFSEDGTSKVVEILADMTARDLCQLLVYRSHCVDDNSWTLVEHHPHLGLERCLEDHELVTQVESTMASESKFLFRKNYAKYEFFKNPMNFFPEQMVTWCQQSNGSQTQLLQVLVQKSAAVKNFLNSSSCPEIQGVLHVKELGRKSWKKLYVCLRRSGLYCSTKGASKEPRHLQLLADLEDSNIYSLMAGKKQYGAPTDFGFCIKPNKVRSETKEMRMLCAEDEQGRTCWVMAFRLLKYGMLLYQNYRIPQQRKALLSHFSTPVRSVSENSLVAMDFSGQTGRVIENPVEAQSAALEEGHAWRVSRALVSQEQAPSQVASPSDKWLCEAVGTSRPLLVPSTSHPTLCLFHRGSREEPALTSWLSHRTKRSTRMNILGSQSPLYPSTLSTGKHACWSDSFILIENKNGFQPSLSFTKLLGPECTMRVISDLGELLCTGTKMSPLLSPAVIHRTQHWFHGRISREESHRIIKQQGLVDGLFLLRDSQSNPKAFVLTLCHHQKIKNFQILPCEDDGQMFFSLDDGNTKFSDLIQLVDFYQLNKGILPCKLKHHCIRVAL
ncbi:Growth factor receptor-bound protein 10 [Galemys pyrenaicus]|uniref:Growth factor receptor-bound protein 10 n=2 Tax=Laurasiatheria TaxID=314145 RepID=A0A8J6DLH9_GALPY|nr:Growth factor receptor-bound protein 10 [Galemys pyrenaicus]